MSLFKPGYSIVQDKVDVLKTTIGVRRFISHDNQEVQQMKNRRTIKRAALMALALLVVLTLTGCGKEPEMVYTPHDEVKISEGDSIDVTLSNLPEGHEASEFSWTGDFDGDPLTGSVKITKSGKGSVAATLTTQDYFYREVFPYILYPTPEVFRLDQTEIEFVMDLQGMDGLPASYGAELRVDTDVETAGTGMNIEWSSSDPEVMNVGTRTGLTASEKKSMVIAPRKPGVADITAHFGDAEATCHVTVKEKNAALSMELIQVKASVQPETDGNICLFETIPDEIAVRELVNLLMEKSGGLAAVFFPTPETGYRYIIGSRRIDLRKAARDINAGIGGRGGGKPEMIQGSAAASEEEIRRFILGFST